MSSAPAVLGTVDPSFENVREAFEQLASTTGDCDGQFCAYVRGRRVVDLWRGLQVDPDDLQGVFSSTKGVSGICIGLLVERGQLELDLPVSNYWPEFAAGGKADITVRTALSHRAGLVGVEPQLSLHEILDHAVFASRLAVAVPHWLPGTAHGYHGFTLGTIVDELVRRVTGTSVAEFFRAEIGDPRGVDFFIGTTDAQDARVKMLLPALLTPEQERVHAERRLPDSLEGMAFDDAAHKTPLDKLPDPLPNQRAVRAAGQPAMSGVGSARGLARLYAMCIGTVDGMPSLLMPSTVAAITQIQSAGQDLVLGCVNRFGVIFEKAHDGLRIGSHLAFGHAGAGGSIGVADPWHDLAYAWIPRRMSFPGGADERGLRLAESVRQAPC